MTELQDVLVLPYIIVQPTNELEASFPYKVQEESVGWKLYTYNENYQV